MDAQQNSDSRARKLALGFVVVVIAILTVTLSAPFILGYMSPYRRFTRKTDLYYSRLADACDLVLQQHPIGTNTFISVPVNEAGIPKIIKDLGPTKIKISQDRVWIGIGESRPGFGLAWEPDEGRFNFWTLTTYADGHVRTWYSRRKAQPQPNLSMPILLAPVKD